MNLTKNTTKTYFLLTFRSLSDLHQMKVSDRDRNVNKKLVLVVFLVKFIIRRGGKVSD